jgi:hypothetical protein
MPDKTRTPAKYAGAEPAGSLELCALFKLSSELLHAAARQSASEPFSLQPPLSQSRWAASPSLVSKVSENEQVLVWK